MKMSSIGRGKNMSIAKAALIVFYKHYPNGVQDKGAYIYSGNLEIIHEIVDVAGAKHASVFTKDAVLSCLCGSDLWEANNQVHGWGGRLANCYTPTEKGINFYNEKLKNG